LISEDPKNKISRTRLRLIFFAMRHSSDLNNGQDFDR